MHTPHLVTARIFISNLAEEFINFNRYNQIEHKIFKVKKFLLVTSFYSKK